MRGISSIDTVQLEVAILDCVVEALDSNLLDPCLLISLLG